MCAALSDIVWPVRPDAAAGGRGQQPGRERESSVMCADAQTAHKTVLTHVFKPRWLVLILLSAGNRRARPTDEGEQTRPRAQAKAWTAANRAGTGSRALALSLCYLSG